MNNLVIANPERLDDQSFKITISGKDYEYEISEDKDIDKVIAKLSQWISRGEDSFGGLYDYIKRSFQLVGEYEEPVVEDDIPEEPVFELPSEGKDLDDVQSNELEFKVDILSDNEVSISLGEFSAVFSLSGDVNNFETDLRDLVKEDMTLKDRIDLNTFLIKELDTDNSVDIYNLSGLILDPDFEIVSEADFEEMNSEEVQDDTIDSVESDIEDISDTDNSDIDNSDIDNSDTVESEDTKGNLLKEDLEDSAYGLDGIVDIPLDSFPDSEVEVDFTDDTDEELTLDSLIASEDFLASLRDLGLSLFKFTNNENGLENLYFVGGINSNDGSLYTLTYKMDDSYSTLDGDFKDLSTNEYELSNIEDLSIITDYLNTLLDLVYNRELGESDE